MTETRDPDRPKLSELPQGSDPERQLIGAASRKPDLKPWPDARLILLLIFLALCCFWAGIAWALWILAGAVRASRFICEHLPWSCPTP